MGKYVLLAVLFPCIEAVAFADVDVVEAVKPALKARSMAQEAYAQAQALAAYRGGAPSLPTPPPTQTQTPPPAQAPTSTPGQDPGQTAGGGFRTSRPEPQPSQTPPPAQQPPAQAPSAPTAQPPAPEPMPQQQPAPTSSSSSTPSPFSMPRPPNAVGPGPVGCPYQ